MIRMLRLPIKTYMVIYLAVVLVLSAVLLGQPLRILLGLEIVALYVALDLFWTYFKRKIWYVPTSSVISALIIALIFDTQNHAWFALLAALLAVGSKHLLHFRRIRHLMNPAAFALVVISLFAPVVSWWGATWGTLPLAIIVGSGAYILGRLRRFDMAGAFLLVYAVLFLVAFFVQGGSAPPLLFLFASIVDGTLLFFTTIMLIEPVTSSFPKRRDRLWFGALVGALAVLASLLGHLPLLGAMDPLLLALVVGTMVMGLRTLPKKMVPLAHGGAT